MERLTNVQVTDFLRDYAKYSDTELLEESKTKTELEKIAKARGIQLKGSKDLAGFKTIYTFANKANKNRARLPKKALLKALPSIIGKPIDVDHNRRYVIGHYIDYKYIQKDDMVVAYGVLYKSNFAEEWETAKQLFKSKKLSTSYEIWCPTKKRRKLDDGTYELLDQEIAGGALLFKDEPAFEDAKVLEMAKKRIDEQEDELVYASKYKDEDLIKSNDVVVMPQKTKIKCANCGEEFESGIDSNIKCPKCLAIVDKAGQMVYPPQIKDFKLLCPACKVNNWLIYAKTDTGAKLRCLSCAKEYKVTFAKTKDETVAKHFQFLYTGRVRCLQCGKTIEVSGTSAIKDRMVICPYCKLEFSYNIMENGKYKKISKVEEITSKNIDNLNKSSEKGGTEMADKEKVKKASEEKVEETHDFLEKSEIENKDEISKRLAETKDEISHEEEAKAETEDTKEEKAEVVEETPTEATEDDVVEEEKTEAEAESKDEKAEDDDKAEEEQPEAKVEEAEEAPKAEENAVEEAKKDKYYKTKTIRKALAKTRDLEKASADMVEKQKAGVRKMTKKYLELKKASEDKIKFYMDNAKKIIKRRAEVEGSGISDEDLMNDDKFERAKAELENAKLKAQLEKGSEIVGSKVEHKDDAWYAEKRRKINEQAFPNRDEE